MAKQVKGVFMGGSDGVRARRFDSGYCLTPKAEYKNRLSGKKREYAKKREFDYCISACRLKIEMWKCFPSVFEFGRETCTGIIFL